MSLIIFLLLLLIMLGLLMALVVWVARKILGKNLVAKHSGENDAISKTMSADFLDSISLRAVIIGFLAFMMLVPLGLVRGIVDERGYRYQSVLSDIASTWGQAQTLMAPVVNVPYSERVIIQEAVVDKLGVTHYKDKTVTHHHTAHFLPASLDINVELNDELRHRGIFKSLVYSARVLVEAEFSAFDVNAFSENITDIQWEKSWISIGLTDTGAINEVNSLLWNTSETEPSPGTVLEFLPSGFHSSIDLATSNQASATGAPGKSHTLSLDMNVKGSGAFMIAPFGKDTRLNMTSAWPHPSFQGDALPDSRNITAEGFSAEWKIPHLARNYPQRWTSADGSPAVSEFVTGVSMFEPLSLYSQVTRAVKYGILFIGLTFLTLFIFELAVQKRLHVVQYALIGVSLSMFYLVLLSLAEHIQFLNAYIAAAALTITMISVYTWVVMRNFPRALSVFTLLVALYALLFSLLQLEDYALLMGTALLTAIVMVLMFVTRNIQKEPAPGSSQSGTLKNTD